METQDNAQRRAVLDSTKFLSSTLSLDRNKISGEQIMEPKMDLSPAPNSDNKTLVQNINVSSEVFIDPQIQTLK